MKSHRSVAALVVLLTAVASFAQSSADDDSRVHRAARVVASEAKRYVIDAKSMFLAPGAWDAAEWQRAGFAVASIGGAFTIDDETRRIVQNNRTDFTQSVADFVTPFGGRRAEYISIAMLVTGFGVHDTRLRDTGRDALEATILAGRIATPILKELAGRSRPYEDEGSLAFDPFSGNQSFPSGHATGAFAVASVVAAHYDGWKIPTLAWTLASSVAVARVHDDVHWTSDVLAGAIIGTSIGRGVVARHCGAVSRRDNAIRITPFALPRGGGVFVTVPLERLVG